MNTENMNLENTEEIILNEENIEAIEEAIDTPAPKLENYEHKVSVIMPVYNADNYIRQAIETVLAQTLTDFELICVDDGSTDKSVEIIKSYAKKDARIQLIEMNHIGISTARNKGLLKSTGEYVIFLDADDFYEETLLEKLYNTAKDQNLDIVATGFDLYDTKKARFIKSAEEEHGNIGHLLSTIRNDVRDYVGKADSLDAAIRHHAHVQVERIIAYPHVAEKIAKGKLLVKKAYYDVNTGKVTY